MPFSFRRVDPRRTELEELRSQIAELQNELAVLESTAGETDPGGAEPTPAPGEADIYQSVSRLRVTMVHREVRIKRQQLEELSERESALARTLRLPPLEAAPRVAPSGPTTNGKTAPAATPALVTTTSAPRGSAAASQPTNGSVAPTAASGERAAPAAGPGPRPRRAPINVLNLVLAVAAIVLVLAVGLVLSGLLEIDPNKPYGVFSAVARVVQGATIGWIRPGAVPPGH